MKDTSPIPTCAPPTRDIETREDCDRLVRAFYEKALVDPIIGFIFVDVAHLDLEAHLPVIASFWETMLLGNRTYDGNPFAVHVDLHARVGFQQGHFKRWLRLWCATVDELFCGERAELAKHNAVRVADAFHRRLRDLPSPLDAPAEPPGVVVLRHGGAG